VYRGFTEAPIELTATNDGRDEGNARCTVIGLWTRRR
jgi:hypothetical protein